MLVYQLKAQIPPCCNLKNCWRMRKATSGWSTLRCPTSVGYQPWSTQLTCPTPSRVKRYGTKDFWLIFLLRGAVPQESEVGLVVCFFFFSRLLFKKKKNCPNVFPSVCFPGCDVLPLLPVRSSSGPAERNQSCSGHTGRLEKIQIEEGCRALQGLFSTVAYFKQTYFYHFFFPEVCEIF